MVVHNWKEPIVGTLKQETWPVPGLFGRGKSKHYECRGRRSKLENVCETRWAVRSDAFFTFKASFPVVIDALIYLVEDDAECRACGASICRFDFIIALVVCEHVL